MTENLNGIHNDQEITANAGFVEAPDFLSIPLFLTDNLLINQVHLCHFCFFHFLYGCHFRCSVSDQSIGSKPEAVEPHDKKEITEKSRFCSDR